MRCIQSCQCKEDGDGWIHENRKAQEDGWYGGGYMHKGKRRRNNEHLGSSGDDLHKSVEYRLPLRQLPKGF